MRLFDVEVIANGSWWNWTVLASNKDVAFAAVKAAHPGVDFNEHTWGANDIEALILKTPHIFESPVGGGE